MDREIHEVKILQNRLEKNGYIYRGKYSGWYNVSEEAFVPDKDVVKQNSANINEAYTESGDVLEWMEEECYKFRLSSFKDELKHWLKNGIYTNRFNKFGLIKRNCSFNG